jgi:hypothetical protein
MTLKPALLVAAMATALLGGCGLFTGRATSSVTVGSHPEARGNLGTLTYRAVDRLVAESPDIRTSSGVMVGSIVEVQRVDRTTPFGNLVADLARSRMVQEGVPVAETRLRSSVLLDRKEGEITLAHDRRTVVAPPTASGILTGTYAAGEDWIYVSLKLVSVADAHIVSAVDYVVPRQGSEALLMPGT